MASRRLTDELRRTITKNILDHRFKAEGEKLVAARFVAAEAVYDKLWGKYERAIAELPQELFHYNDVLWLDYKGEALEIAFQGTRVMPDSRKWNKLRGRADSPEVRAWIEADNACDRHEQTIENARQQIRGILHSVTTVKRLLEVWPEIAQFIPDKGVRTGGALVPTVTQLNRELKLPPKV